MKSFGAYVAGLRKLAEEALQISGAGKRHSMLRAPLNGDVEREFRTRVSLDDRRAAGAFFTGASLATRLSKRLLTGIGPDAVIADPACGAGDLLLAAARNLPVRENISETVKLWGERLMGLDINPALVQTTKIRLLMLATTRSHDLSPEPLATISDLFPLVSQGDFLSCPEIIEKASHILINPPYHELLASPECTWGAGKVSAAALFMDACVSYAADGTRLAAILPDVLRSGSSYEKWRKHIESLTGDLRLSTYGQFDKLTDVDVFLLLLTRAQGGSKKRPTWWKSVRRTHTGKIADYFNVRVGPVVPHRDAREGPSVPYIHARTLPAWGVKKHIDEKRRFGGTLFQPPFVAVRRTSRPGEQRAIGTIVSGRYKVAVENHVLVLLPKNRTIAECRRVLRILRLPETDRWFNERIRCRHLTVQAIKALPWWNS